MYFLVFERQGNGSIRDPQTGMMVESPAPDGCPIYNRVQTIVEADTAEKAVRAVMAQTRRMGDCYGVVECQFFSYIPDNGTEVKNGVVRSSGSLELETEK